MTAPTPDSPPRLTVVLPAGRPETLRCMRTALAAQTARAALEIVVLRWPSARDEAPPRLEDGYAAVQIIDLPEETPLPAARAVGARAATAPLVFFAETHAFPHPGWARAVLDASTTQDADVVASGFVNGNPDGAVSWAAFILDYGDYGVDLPATAIASAPIHKGAFPRSALLAFGERLPAALSAGDELPATLHASGLRAYFEPAARIDHLNVSSLKLWLRGRYLIGFLIGANRAQRWTTARRALYLVLAPAIGALLVWRARPVARRIGRGNALPRGTGAVIVLGAFARMAGEAIAYARRDVPRLQAQADAYELLESVYTGVAAR